MQSEVIWAHRYLSPLSFFVMNFEIWESISLDINKGRKKEREKNLQHRPYFERWKKRGKWYSIISARRGEASGVFVVISIHIRSSHRLTKVSWSPPKLAYIFKLSSVCSRMSRAGDRGRVTKLKWEERNWCYQSHHHHQSKFESRSDKDEETKEIRRSEVVLNSIRLIHFSRRPPPPHWQEMSKKKRKCDETSRRQRKDGWMEGKKEGNQSVLVALV